MLTATEDRLAKSSKGKSADEPTSGPLRDGGDVEDADDYTEHIKVPLLFKQRLERIAQRVNQKRKRADKRKRALGWFVVTHLEEWLSDAEAALGEGPIS